MPMSNSGLLPTLPPLFDLLRGSRIPPSLSSIILLTTPTALLLLIFFTFLTNKQRSNQPRVEVLYQIFIGVVDVREAWRVIGCGPTVLTDGPLVGIFVARSYSIIQLLCRERVVRVGGAWRSKGHENTWAVREARCAITLQLEEREASIEIPVPFYSEPPLFEKIHIASTSLSM